MQESSDGEMTSQHQRTDLCLSTRRCAARRRQTGAACSSYAVRPSLVNASRGDQTNHAPETSAPLRAAERTCFLTDSLFDRRPDRATEQASWGPQLRGHNFRRPRLLLAAGCWHVDGRCVIARIAGWRAPCRSRRAVAARAALSGLPLASWRTRARTASPHHHPGRRLDAATLPPPAV
jgi:hypothetical protein